MMRGCTGILVAILATAWTSAQSLDTVAAGAGRVARAREVCDLGTTIDQMSRELRIAIGFEGSRECWISGRKADVGSDPHVLKGLTIRAALDRIVASVPGFVWRTVGGTIVVRPQAAWSDRADQLNLPANAFSVERASLTVAVHTMLESADPSQLGTASLAHDHTGRWPPRDATITLAFRGGTLLDALVALAPAAGGVDWELGYGTGRPTLALHPIEFPSGSFLELLASPR